MTTWDYTAKLWKREQDSWPSPCRPWTPSAGIVARGSYSLVVYRRLAASDGRSDSSGAVKDSVSEVAILESGYKISLAG